MGDDDEVSDDAGFKMGIEVGKVGYLIGLVRVGISLGDALRVVAFAIASASGATTAKGQNVTAWLSTAGINGFEGVEDSVKPCERFGGFFSAEITQLGGADGGGTSDEPGKVEAGF